MAPTTAADSGEREREAAVAVECTAVECSGVAVASSRRVEATFSFLLSK